MQTLPVISIIGAGNVGYHLGHALKQSGYTIRHVISRSLRKAEQLAKLLEATPDHLLETRDDDPDIFLVCVNDDHIGNVTRYLYGTRAIVAHTAGSVGMDVLQGFGEQAGVFYPLQTFSREAEMNYSDIPFLLEAGSSETMVLLKEMASRISGIAETADSETRMKVHVAAVFACNFANHMAAIADDLLTDAGLRFELLLPLISQTNRKLETMAPRDAQTGPAARHDAGTIEKHLQLLKAHPKIGELYRMISEHIEKSDNRD